MIIVAFWKMVWTDFCSMLTLCLLSNFTLITWELLERRTQQLLLTADLVTLCQGQGHRKGNKREGVNTAYSHDMLESFCWKVSEKFPMIHVFTMRHGLAEQHHYIHPQVIHTDQQRKKPTTVLSCSMTTQHAHPRELISWQQSGGSVNTGWFRSHS